MAYLECLSSFIFDQPIDSLDYLRPFRTLAEGQRVYPNPWTGVSTPLFVHLAETAVLMRCQRTYVACDLTRPQRRSDVDFIETIAKSAKNLFQRVLAHSPPSTAAMDDTKDINTPVDHLVSMDIIYRVVILMELVQAFPRLTVGSDCETNDINKIKIENEGMVVDCAIAILTIITQLPDSSGANIMLSLPLIAAGGALQARRDLSKTQEVTAPRGLRASLSSIMHSEEMLARWRKQTTCCLERAHRRVGVAPLLWATHLVHEVWSRADAASQDQQIVGELTVHWMDIMISEKLETLFG
jgi:hypothetical protein